MNLGTLGPLLDLKIVVLLTNVKHVEYFRGTIYPGYLDYEYYYETVLQLYFRMKTKGYFLR